MATILENTAQIIGNTFSVAPFALSNLPGFPFGEFSSNLERYQEQSDWFYGTALEKMDALEKTNVKIPLYPVRINPLYGTCLKHAYALFGETTDDTRPLVVPRLRPDAQEPENVKLADKGSAILSRLWWESAGRTIMQENAILSQVHGGCVFAIRRIGKQSGRSFPIKIEKLHPGTFLGIPERGDPYHFAEAWVIRAISKEDAAQYNVVVREFEPAYWVEHWLPDRYSITINDKPVRYTMLGETLKSSGPNLDGVVPFVYIPHIRAGSKYGLGVIDNLKGLVAELNLRVADYGDAVNADSHPYLATRNINGALTVERVESLKIIALGSTPSYTGNEREPDLFQATRGATAASSSMKELIQLLMNQYRRDSFVPAVADGEDEGSQRSALTLTTRMWPLVSHTNMERVFWSDGLSWLNRMALLMLKNSEYPGIEDSHLDMLISQEWSPPLPKDREQFMNEMVNRWVNGIGAPDELLEMVGDIEDVPGSLEKIKEWMKFTAELKTNLAAQAQGNQGNGGATTPAKNQTPSKTSPKKSD